MTGPALHGTETSAPERGAASSRSPQLRMMLGLARIEALRMTRSWLVLGGLLAGILLIWSSYGLGQVEPLWWEADWRIGGGQLFLGMTVLAAAQLAAGRPRRDGMADLYASFPATASTRTLACLAGLAGALPAGLLMVGAGALMVQLCDPIGAPSVTVLAAGLLLVLAAGAAGTAIGTRFPHPLAGLLGALALFLPTATAHVIPGWIIWLIPWQLFGDQLGSLPGPLTGYPPAGAHAAELAGVAVLAAIVALAMTTRRGRARGWLAAGGVLAVAAIFFAGAVQLEPVPAAELSHLAAEMADPGSVQQCTTVGRVRYCLYPGFGRELSSFEVPVGKVLALVPDLPGRPLTVRQVLFVSFADRGLARGQSQQQISRWNAQTRYAPGNDYPTTTAIYVPVGGWPAGGGSLTDVDFDVALTAAEWAVGLPPTSQYLPCVAVDQAREAIAVWLAIRATNPPAGELQGGVNTRGSAALVHNTSVPMWTYPGEYSDVTGFGPQPTAVGYLLAKAMTGLPERQVSQVLKDRWATWLNWHTSDTQLAAALGIKVPSVPVLHLATPQPSAHLIVNGQPPQQNPVCTT
jgi:hypothetical protein